MAAYYNEFDKGKAAWLRELISRGLIASGEVDERSIADVRPDDLRGFRQCHFFAGIGIWSYALRLAGWPDDREVWTGSCPCQPFSDAGKKEAFDDARHLWPVWFPLIEARRPIVCFGEQVASADGLAWFDAVYSDLDNARYSAGAVDMCAAGVGAPHRRQRLYWVADCPVDDAAEARRAGRGIGGSDRAARDRARLREPSGRSASRVMADANDTERRARSIGRGDGHAEAPGWNEGASRPGERSAIGGLEDAHRLHAEQPTRAGAGPGDSRVPRSCDQFAGRSAIGVQPGCASPVNGFWRDADWIFCRDRKWRPVEAGTFPLAHGTPARMGRLRGYGDGIVAQVAAAFVKAYMEVGR